MNEFVQGDHYKFRVKAVNKEGASDPLENDTDIVAKNPFDRPGKPGKPEPTDWDSDHVDIKVRTMNPFQEPARTAIPCSGPHPTRTAERPSQSTRSRREPNTEGTVAANR